MLDVAEIKYHNQRTPEIIAAVNYRNQIKEKKFVWVIE